MEHHPEQQDDEIYMGNTNPEDVHRSSWRTSRLGKQPLMRDGTPIDGSRLRPWFIQISEVQQSIETERKLNKPWSAERIATLQPMVDQRTAFVVATEAAAQ